MHIQVMSFSKKKMPKKRCINKAKYKLHTKFGLLNYE